MRIWLKTLRKKRNLTQRELASKFGIAPTTYAALEHGERQKDMGISIAVKIADFFEISLSTIRDYEEARIISENDSTKKQ